MYCWCIVESNDKAQSPDERGYRKSEVSLHMDKHSRTLLQRDVCL